MAAIQRRSITMSVVLLLALLPALVMATSPCPPGTHGGNLGQPPCQVCVPGTYTNRAGQSSCTVCPAGSYSNAGATSCLSCVPGTYAPEGSGQCMICPEGTYSPVPGASCTPCPPGSYCTGMGQTGYTLCAPGTFTAIPGEGACADCPPGTFAPFEGSTSCCQCCSGFYSAGAGQTQCTSCPVPGTYSPVGAYDSSLCMGGVSGGLTTCAASADGSCPATGGTLPSQTIPVRRRAPKRRACASGHESCPVYGSTLRHRGYLKGYECVDVRNDLESCGGCVANDSPFGERTQAGGRDCSAIPHVDEVECSKGVCVIGKCSRGYVLSDNGENCVQPLTLQ
ncbi:hypothetical protein BV20DRAFT_965798 [Pilatotrama ljubarskyi]|nr:hypothetical protein BV20DRAFT_965798 [Pilatotrama ljubarskyi]